MNAHSIHVSWRAGAEDGALTRFLVGHGSDVVPWELDGRTIGPEIPCDAWDTRSATLCLGIGIVEVQADEHPHAAYDGELAARTLNVVLCGRHFNLHRKGIGLVLA